MECSGNTGLPFFNGGIGNATWAGTPLAAILEEAGRPGRRRRGRLLGGRRRAAGPGRGRDHRAVRPEHVARRRDGPRQPARLRDERGAAAAAARLPGAPDRPRLVRHRQRQVADPDRGARRPLPGPLHGPRLRHRPRGDPRRRDGLDLHLGRAGPPQVRPRQGDQAGRRLPDHGRRLGRARSPGSRSASTTARGNRRPSPKARARTSPGSSGPSIGRTPNPASTPSPRGRPPPTARSSRRPTKRTWPARRPTGRATATSPAASTSPDRTIGPICTPYRTIAPGPGVPRPVAPPSIPGIRTRTGGTSCAQPATTSRSSSGSIRPRSAAPTGVDVVDVHLAARRHRPRPAPAGVAGPPLLLPARGLHRQGIDPGDVCRPGGGSWSKRTLSSSSSADRPTSPVLDTVKLRTGPRGGLTRHAPRPVRSVAAVVRGRSDAAARNPNG